VPRIKIKTEIEKEALSNTLLSRRDSVNFSFSSTFDSSSVSYSMIKIHGKTKSITISKK
jgi:hypothetical protein